MVFRSCSCLTMWTKSAVKNIVKHGLHNWSDSGFEHCGGYRTADFWAGAHQTKHRQTRLTRLIWHGTRTLRQISDSAQWDFLFANCLQPVYTVQCRQNCTKLINSFLQGFYLSQVLLRVSIWNTAGIVVDWKDVGLEDCIIGKMQDWKREGLEGSRIEIVQDWKSRRFEKCRIGRV